MQRTLMCIHFMGTWDANNNLNLTLKIHLFISYPFEGLFKWDYADSKKITRASVFQVPFGICIPLTKP